MLTNFYLNMTAGFSLPRAFELSFGVTLRTFLINLVSYVVLIAILTYALIFAGDMVTANSGAARQAAYVRELERVDNARAAAKQYRYRRRGVVVWRSADW